MSAAVRGGHGKGLGGRQPMSIPDRALLDWVEEAPADRGLHFAGPGDSWEYHSYAQLAELVLRTAEALRGAGVRDGEVVAIVQRSSPGFVATFFGAIAAGGTPCSIPPPFAFQRAVEYEAHAGGLLETARPAVVVCDQEAQQPVAALTEGLGLPEPLVFDALVEGVSPARRPYPAAESALLQFTSGSSGASRGVLVSHSALRANVTAMRRWLGWRPEYPGITWLPVHHDMGLLGCMVNIVTTGCDGWMLQPEDFIRSPLRYLRCISENQVGLAAMPNFGLAYILRRVRPADLEGLRFDAVRSVILGAERIDEQVLTRFEALLGPHGFDRRALLPAYGGAEATLAVTGLPLGEGWTSAVPEGDAGDTSRVVGCGRPLEGVEVSVQDDEGRPVPDGVVGEVVVRGASLATRYVDGSASLSGTELAGGVLRTGDAGFLGEGQLYVLGRLGDGLKVRGRMVFAESLEARLHELGIPQRRVAVLLGQHRGRPTGVVVLEKPDPDWAARALPVLAEALDDAELLVAPVPRGQLAVTSSGKPRRRVMWKALTEGRLSGEVHRPAPV
ncbi:AMP-binding protein [Streptomyces sp. NPDC020362]|uniref:AMP-binding protein n=1 Tax=unclassified Streptomyces TaxID=2593676 RepID=UPI000A9B16C7